MSLPELARRVESITSTAAIGGRTLLGLDTNPVPREWTHITKVDPETDKKLPLAYPLYLAHTSAVSVGGSSDVTAGNTEETFELLAAAGVPAFHEPSDATHVTETTRDYADFLAVPEVLNGDSEALVGTLGRGLDYVREDLGPEMLERKFGISLDGNGFFGKRISNFAAAYLIEEAIFEAYIIMNLDSAAAREANVTEENLLSPREAKQRALAAEYHLDSEVIYLEYSGTYGGDEALEILREIDDVRSWSRLWYGGGLESRDQVEQIVDAGADAVIVGNAFHEVAEEERALFEQGREEFNDGGEPPERAEIESWLETALDEEEGEGEQTRAERYLSTITAVDQPAARAHEYLAAGIEFGLALEALGADIEDAVDEPSGATVKRHVRRADLADTTALGERLPSETDHLVDYLAASLLSARFETDGDSASTARQVGIEL